MYSEKAQSIVNTLGTLAGKISEEDWALLRVARNNLADLVNQLEALEKHLLVPLGAAEKEIEV